MSVYWDMPNQRFCLSVPTSQLVEEYRECRSFRRLGLKYGCDHHAIKRILQEAGADVTLARPTGNGNTKYRVRYDYFATIDSHEKAYILGFLWADGHNERREGKCDVRMALHEKDFYILEYMRDCLYPDRDKPVYRRLKKRQGVLSIRTKAISDDLARLGMLSQKTVESHLPSISDNYMPSFMLGYFDGDGCVYLQRRKTRGRRYGSEERYTNMAASVDIISNRFIVEEIAKWFGARGVKFKSKVLRGRNPHYPHIYICSFADVKRFYDIIYQHQKVFLTRKRERFDTFFRYKQTKIYGSGI